MNNKQIISLNNSITQVKRIRFLILCTVLITFFMRPFALGLDNSVISTLVLFAVSLLISAVTTPNMYARGKIFVLMLLFYAINIVSLLVLGAFSVTNLVSLFQLVIVFLLFQSKEVMYYFFYYLKYTFLILCVLGILNFILETIYSPDSLILLKGLTYNEKVYTFDLYFPLTWSNMQWLIPGDSLFSGFHARQYYFFVEPGMAPTFLTAMIIIIINNSKEKNKVKKVLILTLGLLLTFSLGGIVILVSSLGVYYFLNHYKNFSLWKLIVAVGFVALTLYAYEYMPIIGRAARVEISAQSAESIETHENVSYYIASSVLIMGLLGLILTRYKKSKSAYLTIVYILCVGYLSNYIGFTTLATMFLFWDGDNGLCVCPQTSPG